MGKINIVQRRLDLSQNHRLTSAERRAQQRTGTGMMPDEREQRNDETASSLEFPLSAAQRSDFNQISKPGKVVDLVAHLQQETDGVLVLKIEQSAPEPRKLLSTDEVAQLLGVSRSCIYRFVKEDQLEPLRIGRLLRFTADEVNRFLRDCRAGGEGNQ